MNHDQWTIVGVMPASFVPPCSGASAPFVWIPMLWTPEARASRETTINVFGRLASGTTVAAAQAELDVVMANRRTERNDPPGLFSVDGAKLEVLGQSDATAVRPGILLLQGIGACLLLIACANLANLFLAHTGARKRELAMRVALGAGRRRLVRQLLTEAAVIGTVGGGLGVAVAYWTVPVVAGLATPVLPRGVSLDVRTPELALGLGLGWLAALVFGIAPAVIGSKADLLDTVRTGAPVTAGRAMRLFRGGLIVGEVLLALVVLTGAGLLIKSFVKVVSIPVGFETRHLLDADLRIPDGALNRTPTVDGGLIRRVERDLRTRLGDVPIAFSRFSPFEIGLMANNPWRLTRGSERAIEVPIARANVREVSPNYFDVIGLPLMQGRLLRTDDGDAGPSAAVVSQAFAKRFGGGGNVLGAEIREHQQIYTIVGVVPDVRTIRRTMAPLPAFYVPLAREPARWVSVLVRSSDERGVATAIRETIRTFDPDVSLMRVESLATTVSGSEAERRFYLTMVSVFAGLAGVLTALGIYGVVAHVMGLRSRELGIRLALGARPSHLKRLVIRQGLVPVAIGVVGGMVGGWWLAALMQANSTFASLLYEVKAQDGWTFAVVAVGAVGTAVVACWIPAREITQIDRIVILREE